MMLKVQVCGGHMVKENQSNFLQHLLEDPQALPGQLRDTILPGDPGSTLALFLLKAGMLTA